MDTTKMQPRLESSNIPILEDAQNVKKAMPTLEFQNTIAIAHSNFIQITVIQVNYGQKITVIQIEYDQIIVIQIDYGQKITVIQVEYGQKEQKIGFQEWINLVLDRQCTPVLYVYFAAIAILGVITAGIIIIVGLQCNWNFVAI
uniref:Transmembrane domain-containing protein n=1 Tax=Elaeophora elaphi TaxID=1147741 RepID=A0A0R3RY41_9BILA